MPKQRFELREKTASKDLILTLEYDVSKAYGVLPDAGQVPGVPTDLSVNPGVTSAFASCSPVSGADTYYWYLNNNFYVSSSESFITIIGLTKTTSYSVAVAAVNQGVGSAPSSAVIFTTQDNFPPVWGIIPQQELIPGSFFSLDLGTYVNDVDTNAASLVYSVDSGTLRSGLSLVGSLVSGTPTGTGQNTVVFSVTDGITSVNQSVVFNCLNADTTAPGIPANFAAVPYSATQVHLSWNNPTDTEVAGARTSGFRGVQYYKDGVRIGTVLATNTPNNEIYVEATASANWKIRSIDEALNTSGFSSEIAAGPLLTIIDPPSNFAVVRNSTNSATATWAAPASGPAPTSYKLYRSLSPGGPFTAVYLGTALFYTETNLQSTDTPYYYVTSVNGVAESSPSQTLAATLGSLVTLHEDDFNNAQMRSTYDAAEGSFGPNASPVVTAADFVGKGSSARWQISSVGDLCYNRDPLIHTTTELSLAPGFTTRSARVQLTLDRAADNNGKIERNEIIPIPYNNIDSAMYRGNEYWFAFRVVLADGTKAGAPRWNGSNIYTDIFQMKATEFNGPGVTSGLKGPHFTIGPDYGYKVVEGGLSHSWRLFVRGYTGTQLIAAVRDSNGNIITPATGNGNWVIHEVNAGSFAPHVGHCADFIVRVIPEYRNTWTDSQGRPRSAITQIWLNDVLVLSRIGFSNCVYNAAGYAYAVKTGLYCGFANPNYISGPMTKYVHWMGEWKEAQFLDPSGSRLTSAVDQNDPGYQYVKPRGVRF